MCKQCEKLLNVHSDKKAKQVIKKYDAIDATLFETFMEVNHHDDGEPFAFIQTQVNIESTERTYGMSIPIKYCPFCGTQLIK